MSYQLCAAIGGRALIDQAFGAARAVPLTAGLGLVPLEPRPGRRIGLFYDLTVTTTDSLVAASAHGLLAYVEAEFFGSSGVQSAIAWRDGEEVLGPLHTQTTDGVEEGSITSDNLAINQALRLFGVTRRGWRDEFESVGLGRYRTTQEWLASTRPRMV